MVLALTARGVDAQSAVPERNQPLIALIDGFMKRPFQEDARTAILDSAEARSDVVITLSTAVMPSFCYKDEASSVKAFDALLLTAFVAGNMRAQLVAGRAGEDVEAGLRSAVAVYATIRERVPQYYVPELNEWQAADSAGRLSAVAERLARTTKECRKKAARFPKNAVLAPARP